MTAELIDLQKTNLLNIPETLRKLADQIESGEFGDITTLAYVTRDSYGDLDIGIIGESGIAAETLYFILARAQAVLCEKMNHG